MEKTQKSGLKLKGVFKVECFDKSGKLKWIENFQNLVVDEYIFLVLDTMWPNGGGSAPSNVYVGLTNDSPTPAAGDTMSSHGGWTENQNYSESTRPAYDDVRSSKQISNTASKASYSINASTSFGGAFLTTNNTKGGTTGTLICVAAFVGGNKSADNGDTLEVTYNFSADDDGA